MALTKISSPDILAPVGARSYWVTSGNPIIFKYQRKDISITSITNGSGKIKVSMAMVPSDAVVGEQVYISNNVYEGSADIILIGVGFIVLDINYAGSSTGGFVNLTEARTNYYVEVIITKQELPGTTIGTYKFFDDPTGLVTMNFQDIINSEMDLDRTYDYSLINDRDFGGSFAFNFRYREMWRDSPVSSYSAATASYFALHAVKQLGDEYGSNLRDYMIDIATDPIQEDYIAKFLTEFERPVYFVGYPFTLSFLYNYTIADYFLVRKEQEKDVNGNNVGAETSANLRYEPRTYLNRVKNRTGYASNIKSFEFWLEQGDEIDFTGSGYGTGTGGGGASTDYFAEDYDENWGT